MHKRSYLLFMLLAGALFAASEAEATCTYINGSLDSSFVYIPSFPGAVSVSRNAPVGTVVVSVPAVTAPLNAVEVNCTGDSIGGINLRGAQPTASSPTLYPIGDTGLSFRITRSDNGPVMYYRPANYVGYHGTGSTKYGFELVVTGPIVNSVTIPLGPILDWKIGSLFYLGFNLQNRIEVSVRACTTSDVTVPLGTWRLDQFTHTGATSAAVPFSVKLAGCPGGMGGVKYTIDPLTPVIDQAGSIVALDASSTAAGLGVQLMDRLNQPVPLGSTRSVDAYSGQAGDYSIDLAARYYQTAGSVTAGAANSAMTFTMTYE